jgi:hypothetical protein
MKGKMVQGNTTHYLAKGKIQCKASAKAVVGGCITW